MVSVARIIPPPSARREAVHYHVFLTSVMMSRFGQVSKLIAFACWGLTTALGLFSRISWLWWILPFRAVLTFAAAFMVLIYRKAYLRVSNKPYPNLAVALFHKIGSIEFLSALAVYSASAQLFFILVKGQYGTPVKTTFRPYEPPTLNEQYIYLNSFAVYLAVFYAVSFVAVDYDLVRFPLIPSRSKQIDRVIANLNGNFILALIYSIFATLSYPIVYYLFLRRSIWTSSLTVMRYFTKLHRSNAYISFPVSLGMLFTTFLGSFLLFTLWEFVNSSFNVYMSLGPNHRGSSISEKSDDPNGTLVTGLQAAPREYLHTMAFQELCAISLTNPDRRIGIYKDIERDPEPTIWKQICKESLKVVQSVSGKLEKKAPPPVEQPTKQHASPLPSKSVLSVKHDNIYATSQKQASSNKSSSLVETLQDKQAQQSANAIGFLENLNQQFQKQLESYSAIVVKFLATPMGYPFRCTLERKSVSIIPNPGLVHCALLSLKQLVCCSTQEDEFGIVHRDINHILTELDKCISLVEEFLAHPPVHWSDVLTKSGAHVPSVVRMHQVHEMATDTFEGIVDTFQDQLAQLSLSPGVEKRAYKYLTSYDRVY